MATEFNPGGAADLNAAVKQRYEANSNTNAYDDAAVTKLAGIETNATADQSDAEIETAYNNQVAAASQVEAEAGTETAIRRFSPERLKQAIEALAPASGTVWSDPVDANVVPDGDGTRNLGSSTNRYANVHTDSLDLNGNTFDGTVLAAPSADAIAGYDFSASTNIYYDPTNGIETSGTDLQLTTNQRTTAVEFVIDGGGSAITTGIKGFIEVPFSGTIQQVTMLADQTGSIVVDVWKDTYANYPPADADSITASAVPTISSSNKSQDATLTGWTTSITAGDIIGFNVDSASTVERVTISLEVLIS